MFGRISETVSELVWTILSNIWHSLVFLYIFKPRCSLLIRRHYAIANKTNTESLIFFHISAISVIFVKSICCVKREEQNEPIHIPLRLQAFNNRFVVLLKLERTRQSAECTQCIRHHEFGRMRIESGAIRKEHSLLFACTNGAIPSNKQPERNSEGVTGRKFLHSRLPGATAANTTF